MLVNNNSFFLFLLLKSSVSERLESGGGNGNNFLEDKAKLKNDDKPKNKITKLKLDPIDKLNKANNGSSENGNCYWYVEFSFPKHTIHRIKTNR